MEREKVIELADKAGFGKYAYEASFIFQEFARLVELETLERAAVECDSLKVRYKGMAEEEDKVLLKDGEGSDYWSHVSALAGAAYDIRALKITTGEGHE